MASFTDHVKLPKKISKLPIHLIQRDPTGQTYWLLLEYCQRLWPDLNLIAQFSPVDGLSFIPGNVAREVPYIRKDGIRHGCTSNKCTRADSLAFISHSAESDVRQAVEIINYYVIQIPNTSKPPHVCAMVRQMFSDGQIPRMPWDL